MSKNSGSSKGTGVGVAALVVFLGLLFSGGTGFFLGNGFGLLPGDDTQNTVAENAEEVSQESDEEAEEDIPSTIIVSIKEDKVTINGHPVEDEEELRKYVEDYNSDNRTFVLEEEQSILETYNWVKGVFTELDIELKNSN